MSESVKRKCVHPEQHHLHICQLKKAGRKEVVSALTDNPGFICHNCNVLANKAEDLCNCSPFAKKA